MEISVSTRKKYLNWLLLLFFVSLILLYHRLAYIGHFGYDDLQYAALSAELAKGRVDWGDHFSYRWMVTGLTALSYKLFGINDFSSSLPALLVSLATLILICNLLRNYPTAGLTAGMALFVFNHWSLFYADKLMPDVYVAFFSTAAILLYFRVGKLANPFLAPLFALMLAGAFLSKETVILLVPMIVWWLTKDLIKKRNGRFWLISAATGIVLLSVYFILMGKLTGDSFARFNAILDNRYVNFCNYSEQPPSELQKRISYGLLTDLAGQGMLAGFFLFFPALLMPVKDDRFRDLRFFALTSLVLLLSSNFMTISPTAYNPICTDPRHYLFLIPVFAVSGGIAVSLCYTSAKYWAWVAVVSLVAGLPLLLSGNKTLTEQILPVLIVAIAGFLLRNKRFALPVVTILLVAALSVHPAAYIPYARKTNYAAQKEFVTEQLRKHQPEVVVTDEVQKRLITYYAGFSDFLPEVLNWQEASAGFVPGKKTALVTNSYTAYLSGIGPGDLPWFGNRPELVAEKMAVDSLHHLAFYIIRDSKWPQQLFVTENGFEEPVNYWSGGDGITGSVQAHNGINANQPGEYSATFRLPSDTIIKQEIRELLVICSFWLMSGTETDAVLVVSVGENGGDDIWESYPLFPKVKAFGAWSPVTVHSILPARQIRPGSHISIYIWNLSRDEIYCDDWRILLSGL